MKNVIGFTDDVLKDRVRCPVCGKEHSLEDMIEQNSYCSVCGRESIADLGNDTPAMELFDPTINVTFDCCSEDPGHGLVTMELNIRPKFHTVEVLCFSDKIDGQKLYEMQYI